MKGLGDLTDHFSGIPKTLRTRPRIGVSTINDDGLSPSPPLSFLTNDKGGRLHPIGRQDGGRPGGDLGDNQGQILFSARLDP